MSKVVLHIEELQIQGRTALDPAVLQHALQHAVSEHLAQFGIPESWNTSRDIAQMTVRYNSDQATTELLGQHVAHLLYGERPK